MGFHIPFKNLSVLYKKEMGSYRSMVHRCCNPNNIGWKHYGGRGIRVCSRWLLGHGIRGDHRGFRNFLIDLGRKPTKKHTIERLDSNNNYTPHNCIWATMTVQGRNRRNNRKLTHNGQTHCISKWAEMLGLKRHVLANRLERKWPLEKAMTPKKLVRVPAIAFTYLGITRTLPEWATHLSVPLARIHKRWNEGWEPVDIVTVGRYARPTQPKERHQQKG